MKLIRQVKKELKTHRYNEQAKIGNRLDNRESGMSELNTSGLLQVLAEKYLDGRMR